MRTRLSRDKSIQINDVSLPKYGNNLNEVWNLQMPSGGWNGRPERIILNDSIDLIHKDNIYEANGPTYISYEVDAYNILIYSKCGYEQFTFEYKFRILPHGLVSPVGDYNITYQENQCFYNDQNISLIVKYGPSNNPYKYSETVATFKTGKWGTGGEIAVGSFNTNTVEDMLWEISFWVKSATSDRPIKLTYSYSDRYGQGLSGTKETGFYYLYSLGDPPGIKLCSTKDFVGSSVSGVIETEPQSISLSYSKRIY